MAAESPLKRVLSDFMRIEGVKGVLIASLDGFPIDAVIPGGGMDLEGLAAMAVTILGAARSFGEEFKLGSSDLLMAEYSNGTLLIETLKDAVFVVVADKTAILGRIRYEMKRQKPRIEAAI